MLHSEVSLSAFFAAFERPFFLSSSIAFSISQSVATNASLHSIIHTPVISLNSFICAAVTTIIS